MKNRDSQQPIPMSGIISKVMRSLGLSENYDGWQVVVDWPRIVGSTIAEQARAERYENGTLFVAVPDDSWRQQLVMQTEIILRKIQSYPYGRAVKQIRLEKGQKRKEPYGNRY